MNTIKVGDVVFSMQCIPQQLYIVEYVYEGGKTCKITALSSRGTISEDGINIKLIRDYSLEYDHIETDILRTMFNLKDKREVILDEANLIHGEVLI